MTFWPETFLRQIVLTNRNYSLNVSNTPVIYGDCGGFKKETARLNPPPPPTFKPSYLATPKDTVSR